jgi:gamma-polyglutamate synthase
MPTNPLKSWLSQDLSPIWGKLHRFEIDIALSEFKSWEGQLPKPKHADPLYWQHFNFVRFLRERAANIHQNILIIDKQHQYFLDRLAVVANEAQSRQVIRQYLQILGATDKQLRGDMEAFKRWFGADAVMERFERIKSNHERRMQFSLERLGCLTRHLLQQAHKPKDHDVWAYIDIENLIQPILVYKGDSRISETAFDCLSDVMHGMPTEVRGKISKDLVQFIYRAALTSTHALWTQCKALELIAFVAPEVLPPIAKKRVIPTDNRDDLFFRARLLEVLSQRVSVQANLAPLILQLLTDPSEFVRQTIAMRLNDYPEDLAIRLMSSLLSDNCIAVRLATIQQCIGTSSRNNISQTFLDYFEMALVDTESQDLLLRAIFMYLPKLLQTLAHKDKAEPLSRLQKFEALISHLHMHHEKTQVRRWASAARERLMHIHLTISTDWQQLALHQQQKIESPTDTISFMRHLSLIAEKGFGFNIAQHKKYWHVTRDFLWRTKLWRLIQEFKRPATDKRQNYSHVRGRVYPGLWHVPSAIVAEVSPTKIPGEPLHLSEEGNWRPWLPLLDQCLSGLDQNWPVQPLRIVSPEGIVQVDFPKRFTQRLKAKWHISRHFAEISSLRIWTSNSPFPANTYLAELEKLGFSFTITGLPDSQGATYSLDTRVQQFFPKIKTAELISLPFFLEDGLNYFYSIYQNTTTQLLFFCAGIGLLFFGQHYYLNYMFQKARQKIPIVMGGWGTRGKSGTERLKAAVMSSLGIRVISKTTGCEAMFLFGHANRPLTEMFLFRPYDKATIWEQARLTRMAAALGADAYLWECMGLNPRYIEVLQHDWMRDDISTITNCFPDHEDIQGPAGVDLPLVIGKFIPKHGDVYTSEENMLPYLQQIAHEQEAALTEVDWLEVALLTPDVMQRFPYQEHPTNIALVTRMFENVGLRRDFALKEMADRVVLDLGVLKISPEARLQGRRVEFINGMSANERHGTISNWLRTEMNLHRLDKDPGIWTCTVLNNRADRVARTQVFAAILVNDIGADRHFLIGGNQDGLAQFLRESFDEFISHFDWHQKPGEAEDTIQKLHKLLLRWRIALDLKQADARAHAALAGCKIEIFNDIKDGIEKLRANNSDWAEAINQQWQADLSDAAKVVQLESDIASAAPNTSQINETLWQLFSSRIIRVDDYYIPGNSLVQKMILAAPPGLRIRCMGIQNIKGTGLDFVYRWQAWDRHHALCADLNSGNTEKAFAAAQLLSNSTELGVLENEILRELIEKVKLSRIAQTEAFQITLQKIIGNLDTSIEKINTYAGDSTSSSGWKARILSALERFLDAGDAVKRRKIADQIYEDMIAARVSTTRAAYELKKLTQRQKGGWLKWPLLK